MPSSLVHATSGIHTEDPNGRASAALDAMAALADAAITAEESIALWCDEVCERAEQRLGRDPADVADGDYVHSVGIYAKAKTLKESAEHLAIAMAREAPAP